MHCKKHMTRPEILVCHGLDWKLYDNDQLASDVADEFIARNRQEFPWIKEKYADIPSKADPLKASLFYYVFYKGMEQSMEFPSVYLTTWKVTSQRSLRL